MKTLFRYIDFISHSGYNLKWKIECDALSDDDLDTLAVIIADKINYTYKKYIFKEVVGIPQGGLRIAKKVEKLVKQLDDKKGTHILLIDDVLTTGQSMDEYRVKYQQNKQCIGIVLFARGSPASWIHPVFQLWDNLK